MKRERSRRGLADKPDGVLINQIAAEITAIRLRLEAEPNIKSIEGPPRLFYYTEQSDDAEVSEVEAHGLELVVDQPGQKTLEHDLYPLLSQFLWEEFRLYSKRIDEKRSSNNRGPRGNTWLHPDIVGMEDLGAHWHPTVRDCVTQLADQRTRLWSFEVKLLLNRSNVRESYFQAVSNSSWANFGYLVAAEIRVPDTLQELRMLFASHGIGLIKLDPNRPEESQVLIPARERPNVDWGVVSRLASENRDFEAYVKLVKQFHQINETHAADWDIPEETA